MRVCACGWVRRLCAETYMQGAAVIAYYRFGLRKLEPGTPEYVARQQRVRALGPSLWG